MDYFLNDEQKMILKVVQDIAKDKILPVRQELDEKEEFPLEIIKEMAKADLFRIFIPEEYDGAGMGNFDLCIVTEEIAKVCAGVAASYASSALGTEPIVLFGSDEQKKKYLPQIASGEKLAAFGLTESGAGSDVGGIKTTAVKDGDYYILNGTKQWITNGGEAEIYSVIAATNPKRGARGLSAFIVEKGTEGFSFGKKENKLGIRASSTTELIFENVRVQKENLIGKEGKGFLIAMRTFDLTRTGVGALALGIAEGALMEAVKYAKERFQFGQSISSFQAVQIMLADMATEIEAAKSLVYSVARYIDSGAKNYSKESAMAKLYASDVAMKVTTDAVQIFGGYGYMKDYPVEKMMRDAKITQIFEGTNQIQRLVVANRLIKEF
ncbi:acyl-CoA dehydrogenase family protein [candidate division WOR-3 bacterium]|nr:acyl-CoA dehydrogenase family protein [candidate division WOR-3 bacterium]